MDATYIDTCLSGYLLDHHNRPGELLLSAIVDGSTTNQEVLDELERELNATDVDEDPFAYDEAREALRELFVMRDMGDQFDPTLDTPTEEELDMSEPCQAWFLLTWNVPEDEEEEEAS